MANLLICFFTIEINMSVSANGLLMGDQATLKEISRNVIAKYYSKSTANFVCEDKKQEINDRKYCKNN